MREKFATLGYGESQLLMFWRHMPKTAPKPKPKAETPMAKRNREHAEKKAKMTPMARRNYEYAMKKKTDGKV